MSTIVSVIFAILLFSILIFVHELGHFMMAKAFKVQVNEFSMFMGPAIFKKKIGETLYSLRCIPMGGYCAMEGEDEDTDNPRSFQKAAWWKRLIILVAGAAMNFIFGFLIFAIIYLPSEKITVPVIATFEQGSTLNVEGGLQAGDEILEVDGEKIYVASDFSMILQINGGTTHDLVVRRNGEEVLLEDFKMETHEFPNEDGTTSQRYGMTFSLIEPTFVEKLSYIWNYTIDNVRNVRMSLGMLFTGRAGVKDMSGAVGIVVMMSDSATSSASWMDGLMTILFFGGFIAVNLAVMNLLPIPALDGGRAVALLITAGIEGITKKKINPKYEGYIHGAGMILLLGFMARITFKDIFTILKG
jgi:regulator of sigma E protease